MRTKLIYEVNANVGGKIAQVGSRLIDMTAKKMADIFFGKFSKLIEEQNISRETEIKPKIEKDKKNLFNYRSKTIIYVTSAVLIALIIYFVF